MDPLVSQQAENELFFAALLTSLGAFTEGGAQHNGLLRLSIGAERQKRNAPDIIFRLRQK